MKTNVPSPSQDNAGGITSLSVLGARLTWVILGPIAFVLLVVGIVQRGNGWLTGLDGLFGLVVGLMILGRWVEQRSGAATTLTGNPATLQQCKRYIAILSGVAVVTWTAANILGNHILR
jgi:divalent metal cation (Fe/Co/Zn/Cd) transporter